MGAEKERAMKNAKCMISEGKASGEWGGGVAGKKGGKRTSLKGES